VALDSGPQPSLRPPAGASRPAHDSTTLAFVVDEHGHAVIRTARVLGGPAPGTDPAAYRAFVSQVAHALPQFTFRPGVVGTCPVPQLILQAFVY